MLQVEQIKVSHRQWNMAVAQEVVEDVCPLTALYLYVLKEMRREVFYLQNGYGKV